MNGSGKSLHKYLNEYINILGIKDIKDEKKHGYYIPFHKKKEFTNGRILLVGDAAGLTDPITAEGISYAIESGRYAAEAILKGGDKKEMVIKSYERNVKKITDELKYAKILAFFIYSSPTLSSFVFKRYGKKLSELMVDVIMGRKKYSKLLKDPMNYLKLFKPVQPLQ